MDLANETKKGMFENARRGFHNGGADPYGYRNYRYDHIMALLKRFGF